MNGIIVLINSQTGFAADFYFHNYRGLKLKTSCGEFLNLAHNFPYDVKLRLLAHSRSFLANQKARNVIVGADNLLKHFSASNFGVWISGLESLLSEAHQKHRVSTEASNPSHLQIRERISGET